MFRQAPPPFDDTQDETYAYWPLTDVSSGQDLSKYDWTGNTWVFHWANRRNYDSWNIKPNVVAPPDVYFNGKECRAVFTTIAKANAATQCQVRYMLGMSQVDYEQPWLDAGGSVGDFIEDEDFRNDPGTYCPTEFTAFDVTYNVMTDKVLIPAFKLTEEHHKGILLDYECQDDRTELDTENFINALAADIHGAGKELIFYTNPFNAPTQVHTNCTVNNLPSIFAASDLVCIMLWSNSVEGDISESYDNQLAMLGTLAPEDYEKLVITFELGGDTGGTTTTDAKWVHDKLHEAGLEHPDKVIFWRNLAVVGAPLTNEKIRLVCFGE